MTEEWRPVPGYEGYYEVSNEGRVRSIERVIQRSSAPQTVRSRIRKQVMDTAGYPCVSLYRDGVGDQRRVSIFVALAFHGPQPEGAVARHLDDNKLNNHASNIAWGTQADNMRDCVRNGKHYWANLTHCINGHEFTPENTYRTARQRHCRKCARARYAKWAARQKEAA